MRVHPHKQVRNRNTVLQAIFPPGLFEKFAMTGEPSDSLDDISQRHRHKIYKKKARCADG